MTCLIDRVDANEAARSLRALQPVIGRATAGMLAEVDRDEFPRVEPDGPADDAALERAVELLEAIARGEVEVVPAAAVRGRGRGRGRR